MNLLFNTVPLIITGLFLVTVAAIFLGSLSRNWGASDASGYIFAIRVVVVHMRRDGQKSESPLCRGLTSGADWADNGSLFADC